MSIDYRILKDGVVVKENITSPFTVSDLEVGDVYDLQIESLENGNVINKSNVISKIEQSVYFDNSLLHDSLMERDFVWFNGIDSYTTLPQNLNVDLIEVNIWTFDEQSLLGLPGIPLENIEFKQNKKVTIPYNSSFMELGRNNGFYFKGYISNLTLKRNGEIVGFYPINGSDLLYENIVVERFKKDELIENSWVSIKDYFDVNFAIENSWPNEISSVDLNERYTLTDLESIKGVVFTPEERTFELTNPEVGTSTHTTTIDLLPNIPENLSSYLVKLQPFFSEHEENNDVMGPRFNAGYVSYNYNIVGKRDDKNIIYRKNIHENYEDDGYKNLIQIGLGVRNKSIGSKIKILGIHKYLDEEFIKRKIEFKDVFTEQGRIVRIESLKKGDFNKVKKIFLNQDIEVPFYIVDGDNAYIKIPNDIMLGTTFEVWVI